MSKYAKLLVFVLLFILAGCSAPLYYLQDYRPDESTSYRLHYLGMRIYNFSGQNLKEEEWDRKFFSIGAAYRILRECLGTELDEQAFVKLNSLFIIIVPAKEKAGLATLKSFFVPLDRFTAEMIRHELLHPYLFFSRRSILGDPFHADPLFTRCGLIISR